MKKRERDHSTAEQQKRGKTDLSNIYGDSYGDTKPCDVLHLNVGGKRLDVLRRTLCSVENSMLATKFSGRWEDSLDKDRDGNIFIDQEYSLFKVMVDYLRKKEMETDLYPAPPPKFDSDTSKQDFYRMLSYYGMLYAIYPLKLRPNEKYPPESAMVTTSADGTTVIETKSLCTFKFSPYEHGESNALTSFQIKLGEVESCRVGLEMIHGQFKENTSSFEIDTKTGTILESGEGTYFSGEEIKAGTVISAENIWNWYVDGDLLASRENDGRIDYYVPDERFDVNFIFSIHGQVTLMNFKYT